MEWHRGESYAPVPLAPLDSFDLESPAKQERFPTPLTDSGLVDKKELIRLVKSIAPPGESWLSNKHDYEFNDHHLFWPRQNYPRSSDRLVDPEKFRNLAINRLLIQVEFHIHIHSKTLPPPVPSREVMYHAIEGERVGVALFESASLSRRLTRNKEIPADALQSRLSEELEKFNQNLEAAKDIPDGFKLIEPTDYQVETIEDMLSISQHLGQFVIRKTGIGIREVLSTAAV